MTRQHSLFVLMLIMSCVGPAALAQTVTVDLDAERQTIVANGINLEGFHRSGGDDVLPSTFETMMEVLADDLVRVGVPLAEWEPENDDERADHIEWSSFRDAGPVTNSFIRLQTVQERGSRLWLAVWDVADWLVIDPDRDAQRRISDLDELAEAVTAYLLRARSRYGVEPAYVSINEPSIAAENGWGGYQIALTAEEQAALIRNAGARFAEHGLTTKWLIAVHKAYPSELDYAKQIWNAPHVQEYVAGFDFHGYWFQSDHDEDLRSWGHWISSTGQPAFCGECDHDNQFWTREDRSEWTHAIESGRLLHKMYSLARAEGTLVWYNDAPNERRPYRFAARHFHDHLTPGTTLVEATSDSPNILAIAAKGPDKGRVAMILQNVSDEEMNIEIKGLPDVGLNWIQSTSGSYYRSRTTHQAGEGMHVRLYPGSINSFYVE